MNEWRNGRIVLTGENPKDWEDNKKFGVPFHPPEIPRRLAWFSVWAFALKVLRLLTHFIARPGCKPGKKFEEGNMRCL